MSAPVNSGNIIPIETGSRHGKFREKTPLLVEHIGPTWTRFPDLPIELPADFRESGWREKPRLERQRGQSIPQFTFI
jgi:hypothetical protein